MTLVQCISGYSVGNVTLLLVLVGCASFVEADGSTTVGVVGLALIQCIFGDSVGSVGNVTLLLVLVGCTSFAEADGSTAIGVVGLTLVRCISGNRWLSNISL